jgi:hypothetical protein
LSRAIPLQFYARRQLEIRVPFVKPLKGRMAMSAPIANAARYASVHLLPLAARMLTSGTRFRVSSRRIVPKPNCYPTSRPASRARRAASSWIASSCIQITLAPLRIAASTMSGTNSERRKMSTTSMASLPTGAEVKGSGRALFLLRGDRIRPEKRETVRRGRRQTGATGAFRTTVVSAIRLILVTGHSLRSGPFNYGW